jgi:indolepyruvate ferredoxin oxidoreductase
MLHTVNLNDKYDRHDGTVFMSGAQALVRLPLVQIRRDREAGLKTAGFISGYRGSPLGAYDNELWRAKAHLAAHDVVFQPGVNEDLAATAVWGSQQVGLRPGALKDGVFGIWYGKGPGLDRSMDVLKHANAAGTSRHGGVLAIVGDDHGAKSSTLAHQSDHNFMAAFVPFLYPSSVHEYVEYGLLGLAMSRFSGCWVGFKATADTVETTVTVDLSAEQLQIVLPDFTFPEGGPHIRLGDVWREEDTRLQRYKGFAAIEFAKANRIDRLIWDSPRPRLGIITTGKSYGDVLEALDELGIDQNVARDIGLRLYKVGMPWPLEPNGVRHFCEGLEEVLVVEEKREFLEHQLKWQLYNWDEKVRPRVVGKQDEQGDWLLPPDNELSPGQVAHVIAGRIARFHETDRIRAKLAFFAERERAKKAFAAPIVRKPYFCSGCPHNSSTKVPEGSRALAGIGCHLMSMWMDRSTDSFTHMGGEGITWVGEAPFTDTPHIFSNLGDGTYFHSGLLAIRQAVSAKVNMTYKLLYNDAVAMTGGQAVDGQLTVPELAAQLIAEGVKRLAVASEDLTRYSAGDFPPGVTLHDRDDMPSLQAMMREIPGITAIIYDQTCAAEKRRRRKKGEFPDPDKRVFINTAVCEGCGDCSVQSNCVSIEPVETEFGRKRAINQSSCNKDFSCLKGFCPSFVTVEGATIRKPKLAVEASLDANIPLPQLQPLGRDCNIFITGIGGTGVLTISALLGMAAHLEGKACALADMAGLAQKGGAVFSHVRLGADSQALVSPRIIAGGADVLLACDAVVAAGPVTLDLLDPQRTSAVVNADMAPIADFVRNRDLDFKGRQIESAIRAATRADSTLFAPAGAMAVAVLGDAIATNMVVLGCAWQQGLIPLTHDALIAAIRLNRVAVDFNLRAFALGRLLAHDPAAVQAIAAKSRAPTEDAPLTSLEDRIARRASDLTAYQNAAYAARYADLVAAVRTAEARVAPGSAALTEAVARFAYKLMAIKDEYEVARLYTDGRFEQQLRSQFDGDFKLSFNLSPPLLARHDPNTGRPAKMTFGPWMLWGFKALAACKGLRGSPLDLFGRSAERRMERQLLADYEALIARLAAELTPANLGLAVSLASLPDDIRGFGPVRQASVAAVSARQTALLNHWPAGMPRQLAAE